MKTGHVVTGSRDVSKLLAIKLDSFFYSLFFSFLLVFFYFFLSLSLSLQGTVKIWDPTKNICINSWKAHNSFIYCMTILQDNNIATGSNNFDEKLKRTKNKLFKVRIIRLEFGTRKPENSSRSWRGTSSRWEGCKFWTTETWPLAGRTTTWLYGRQRSWRWCTH